MSTNDEFVDIEVTIDSRHDVLRLPVKQINMKELKSLISSSFALPPETTFIFNYNDHQNNMVTFDSDFELEQAVNSCNNPPLLVTAVRQGYGSKKGQTGAVPQSQNMGYQGYGYPQAPYGYPQGGYGGGYNTPYGYPPQYGYGAPPGYPQPLPPPPQPEKSDEENTRIRLLEAQVIALLDQKAKETPTSADLAASSGLPSGPLGVGARLGAATASIATGAVQTVGGALAGTVSVASSATKIAATAVGGLSSSAPNTES